MTVRERLSCFLVVVYIPHMGYDVEKEAFIYLVYKNVTRYLIYCTLAYRL